MEQANTQAPMSQEQIMMLTEMVQQLFRERNREQEPEDPHVTTRISVTDLTSYPALTEALPSIEEDFFRSPLIEEERKIDIYSCPKTSSMIYTPPPLNDKASSTVKKTGSTLYGIQLALAQATRPIDYYIHRRIQENPGMDTAEDTEILLGSTVRALLADIAATVTQARLDNLRKGLDLPGKPTQLIESENKQLMDQEALDALIAKNPAAKRHSNNVTAPNTAAATNTEVNHRTSDRQSNFPGRGRGRGVEGIQNPLHEPKISDIGQGADVSPASVQTEAEPNDQPERLSDVTRPPGCFHAHSGLQAVPKVPPLSLEWPLLPIPRPDIRTITEPFGLHQDPPLSSGMGQIERNSCLCTSRRFSNHGRIQRRVPNKQALKIFQAFAAWIQGQFREVVDHAISVDHPLRNGDQLEGNVPQGPIQQNPGSATRGQQNTERWPEDPEEFSELHWESSINVGRSTSWKTDATPTTRDQKPSSVNIEFMDIDSDSDETSNPEPVLLEESANFMIHLWNSSGPPLLLWNMEPQSSKTPYQHEGTVDSAVCTEAREEDLVPLPQDQHSPTGKIRAIRIKPSGCAQQTDSENRMVYISGEILDAELVPWATRRRPVCIILEQEIRPLLQFVSGQQSTGIERSEPRMDQVQQSVLLPTLEPDSTGSPEGPQRESHNDTSESNVEIRNLVPRPDGTIDFTATAYPSNNSGPRSEKRKVATLGKQELELDGLEDQRRPRNARSRHLCH
ncbi:hypothetical protein AYI69_g2285 [Smittium culicis]|uniref:Uncharacterized protein n=1 Tax=Smittium culicis TaxID=133412 RepID=A0A1R1YMZ1_9FUNG|nr:hypothetical protein AYI69_g2285 [Smittium culicis]